MIGGGTTSADADAATDLFDAVGACLSVTSSSVSVLRNGLAVKPSPRALGLVGRGAFTAVRSQSHALTRETFQFESTIR